MAAHGPAVGSRIIDEWAGGLTWLAHPDESMERASHALAAGDGVWLVEPLEADGIHESIAALGEVAGVVLLIDRHKRDAAAFAERYDVAVHVPEPLGVSTDVLGVPVVAFTGELADTGYLARSVVDNRFWREAALERADGRTAVVPEALGTAPFFTAPGERVGVHLGLRLFPPRTRLGDLAPERLLVGHGPPVLEEAAPAVRDALAGARRRAPRVYWRTLRALGPF